MFNDTIRVKDFPKQASDPDDYLRMRRAADAYLAGLRAGTAGVLDFGTGNYLMQQELRAEQPDGAPLFGRIVGDGPEACVIRTATGKRGLTLVNANMVEVGGIKFSGGPAKTNSLEHVGLSLSNSGNAVSHGCNLHDIRAEHYGVGLMLGEYVTAGAAAEILVSNYGANQCHFGIAGFGMNTLRNTFLNTELNECDNGVYSDSAYGWVFIGGSLGNNGVSFYLRCGGEVIIDGMLDEQGPNTQVDGGFIQYGASTSIRLIVRGCQVLDQIATRSMLDAIKPIAGETTLIMEGSLFSDGTVSASKLVCLIGNSFGTTNPKPYRGMPTDVMVRGCVRVDRASRAPIADFPREDGPGGNPPPPPGPPPGPSLYSVRWDSHGAPPFQHGSSTQMAVQFTNIGNVTLGSGDRLTYWWIKDGKPGTYGDRTPLVSQPVGASWRGPLTVIAPSVAGVYTLRVQLVHEPSTWFSPLDIPVTVI